MKRLEAFCEEAASLLLTAYLFIMFCMFPFYLRNGYLEVGKEKYHFYKAVTVGGFGLIIPLVFVCMVCHFMNRKQNGKRNGEAREKPAAREQDGTTETKGEAEAAEWAENEDGEEIRNPAAGWLGKLSVTDWAALAYGLSVVLSYLGSEYKQMAFTGEDGWYMGAAMQIVFVLSYFLISRFWEYEENMLFPFMGAAGAVFLLGVLNRFSIYPLVIKGAENTSFLSTMGNINWYSGYWAVLFPIGIVLYWKAEKWWFRLAGMLFTALGIATGVSQGSNSAFIVLTALYVFLFCISFCSTKAMRRFFALGILFCAVCQGLRLWRLRLPAAYNYYQGSFSDWITLTRATFAGLLLCLVLYLALWAAERRLQLDVRKFKAIRQAMVLTAVIAVGVYLFLLALNSNIKDGIRFMGEVSALRFDQQWGSARGATWSAGVQVYRNIPGLKKLIGVGPDCFASFLYTIPDLAKAMNKQFDGARLTNAHNEWLNALVNTGIFGLLSYGGIFTSAVVRFVSYGEKAARGKGKYLCIFGFSAFAYTVHNVVSFQQILSTPFVFLMLGMGECLMRMEKRKTEDGVKESKES